MKFTRTAIAGAALAAVLGAGSLATAQAATTATPAPGAVATSHAFKVTAPAQKAITCSAMGGLRIGSPSAHRSRNITVVGSIKCSRAVATLTVTLRLYRNGTQVRAKAFTNHGRKSISGSVARRCQGAAAWYRGRADVRIVFPAGYVPHVVTAKLKTKAVRVHCWR
jgi:hypothetical protein